MLSLLREQTSSNESLSLNKMTSRVQSFEETLLELNEQIHEACINDYMYNLRASLRDKVIHKSVFAAMLEAAPAEEANSGNNAENNNAGQDNQAANNNNETPKNDSENNSETNNADDKPKEEKKEDQKKDDENKKSIFRKIIDAIKSFFRKIADLFKKKEEKAKDTDNKVKEKEKEVKDKAGVDMANPPENTGTDSNPPKQDTNNNSADNPKQNENSDNNPKQNEAPKNDKITPDTVKSFLSSEREFNFYYFPSTEELPVSIYDELTKSISNIILSKIKSRNKGSDKDQIISDINMSLINIVYNVLNAKKSTNKNKGRFKTIDDYKNYIDSCISVNKKTSTGAEFMKNINARRKSPIALVANTYSSKFNSLTGAIDKAINNFASTDSTDQDILIATLNTLTDLARLTSNFVDQATQKFIDMEQYYLSLYGINSDNSGEVAHESSTIHGEVFDSETLFANADYRDFNPTEWLNLQLTTESYEMRYAIREFRMSVAQKEASIIMESDNPYIAMKNLIAMREAEEKKFQNNIDGIIFRIREALNKFIGFVNDKFSKDADIIRKYAKELKQPFNFKEVSFAGNIIDGIDRIKVQLDMTYDVSLKDADRKEVFKTKVLPKLSGSSDKRPVRWDDDMNISDFCNAYFGNAMPEDKYKRCVYTADEFNAVKDSKIIPFLQNTGSISASIKNDINKLGNEAKKIGVAVDTTINNTTSATTTTAKVEETKQEGYFSILYNRYICEADIEAAKDGEAGTDGGTASNGNNTNSKEFFECFNEVLQCKLKAATFIQSELMQVVRHHVGIKDEKKDEDKTSK